MINSPLPSLSALTLLVRVEMRAVVSIFHCSTLQVFQVDTYTNSIVGGYSLKIRWLETSKLVKYTGGCHINTRKTMLHLGRKNFLKLYLIYM